MKSLSYELCFPCALVLPMWRVHFALVCSISWLDLLKFVRFSSHVKRKTMKLSLLHKSVNTSSHKKGNLMALTAVYQFELWLKFEICPVNYHYPSRDHEAWFELIKFSSYPSSSSPSFTVCLFRAMTVYSLKSQLHSLYWLTRHNTSWIDFARAESSAGRPGTRREKLHMCSYSCFYPAIKLWEHF